MTSVPASMLLLAAALAACSNDARSTAPPTASGIVAREVASGLASPLYLTAPAGDDRLFVVEQGGKIRVIEGGSLLSTPFLDISAKVSSGGERGLLSVAFHPRYAQNGYLYVDYTDVNGDTQLERYTVSADRNRADPASATAILHVPQPFPNHNGGLVTFGPDGKLYVGMGDGGGGGDPQGNGQTLGTLLGKLLRIDVDASSPYAVPPDNPFVGRAGARGEIWAYGLRNPWRFAFDPSASRLYVADVGQDRLEEVDVAGGAEAGVNYGWNVTEGSDCYGASSCDKTGLRLPVVEYTHEDGCSITGGYVYRGAAPAMAALRGHYFYSDYCSGWLRSFRVLDDGSVTDRHEWAVGTLGNVLSFGTDAAGELYVLSANGRVYRLDGAQ
jgi:glucose/arabinose dehydrogenase